MEFDLLCGQGTDDPRHIAFAYPALREQRHAGLGIDKLLPTRGAWKAAPVEIVASGWVPVVARSFGHAF